MNHSGGNNTAGGVFMLKMMDKINKDNNYDRDSYDINKAAKDIADKTLKKGTQEKK